MGLGHQAMEGAWTWADGHRDHNPNNHQTNIETFNLQHFNSNKAKIWANEDKLIFPLLNEQLMPEHFMLPEPRLPQDESPKDVPQLPHTAVVPATAALAEDSLLRPRGANL